ncbi:hypothetical protein ABDJ50_14275, partial [Staphylococcus aureus]
LVVMAYVAAGLSLLFGTPARRPTGSDRALGMGALLACGLLAWSTDTDILVGALIVAFASATQDIAVDALRIESAADDEQLGLFTSAFQLGYRIAVL